MMPTSEIRAASTANLQAIVELAAQLAQVRAEPLRFADVPALAQSWADPAGFQSALLEHHARSVPMPKSAGGHGYDLYHDAVLRHSQSGGIALHAYDRRTGWQLLRYAELHALCSRLAVQWAQAGMMPGKTICLLQPMGVELLVELCTAFRLGLRVSLLPPVGAAYVLRRLRALAPDYTVLDPAYQALISAAPEVAGRLVRSEPVGLIGARWQGSHTYDPAAPALALFSPLREPSGTASELSAALCYGGALRDALLVLGLQPGAILSAPAAPLLVHQPLLLMTALLSGATYVHIETAALRADPSLLEVQPVDILAVSCALRDLLRGLRKRLRRPRFWFHDPFDDGNEAAWRQFVDVQGLEAVPMCFLRYDASSGGTVLLSGRIKKRALPLLLPAPGVATTLKSVVPYGQPLAGAVGVLITPQDSAGELLLIRHQDAYLCGGTRTLRRAGLVYPATEVVELIGRLPYVQGSAVVALPATEASRQGEFILVIFTGAEPPAQTRALEPARTQELQALIARQLGEDYLPDVCAYFPLYPRSAGQGIDPGWVRKQYLSGARHRRRQRRIFQVLTALQQACQPLARKASGAPLA